MGAWGYKPGDTDKAQEWLFALWKNYPFQREVERTLHLDVPDYHEDVRAAAFVLHGTRNLFAWDPDDYSRLAALAIEKLEEISRMEIFQDDDFLNEIAVEISQLRVNL